MSNSQDKYSTPSGPPPTYGSQIHHDAGPYQEPNQNQPPNTNTSLTPYHDPRASEQGHSGYNSPAPLPVGGYYGPQQPQQAYYGPPGQQQLQQGGPYYGPPQPQMYYQQQGGMYGPPQGGYYVDNRSRSTGTDICAGLLGVMACCCCLDILF